MNTENTIKKLKQKLLTIKDKNIFYDDFKMIEECKKFILDEIENYTSENIGKTKEDVFTKIFNFFQLEKYFKRDKIISFKIIFYVFLSIALLTLDFILISIFSLLVGLIVLILILLLFFKFINSINKKEREISQGVRINFIIYEALNELKEEFENEKREKFLKPAISVQLEEEELNELLSEDYFEEELIKPEIKTEIYDRKASLERRKRRKNLKTK